MNTTVQGYVRRAAVAAVLALLATPAAAVYKWTDAEGNVHYTDKPPPKDATSTAEVKTAADKADADALRRLYAGQRDEARKEAQAAASEREAAAAEQEAAEKTSNCDRAQANLQALMNTQRIFDVDAAGNRTRVPEESRQARMRQAEEQIAHWCK